MTLVSPPPLPTLSLSLPHKQNIQHWDWLFSIIAWINPQCVTNGNGWQWIAVAAQLVCWYGIIHWTWCGNMEPTANITYWCFVSIKGNSELLSLLFSIHFTTDPTKKNWKRNCNWEIIEMNLGDTFKVRKPPNSLFLDTMEVLNKESWSLLCSSYQWGAELSSCYCHHNTLHCTLHCSQTPSASGHYHHDHYHHYS